MDTFDFSFYKGKKVLVTGHTGFKGSWLCRLLLKLGAEVTGYALEPPTQPYLFSFIKTKIKCIHRFSPFVIMPATVFQA